MASNNAFYLKSLITEVGKEIENGARKQRAKAARFVAKAIRKKISDVWVKGKHSAPGEPPGMITGDLKKGVYTYNGKNASFAGTHEPAYHAFLLEFGHFAGKKNSNRKWVEPRPFVYNTFAECENEVLQILAEPWVM